MLKRGVSQQKIRCTATRRACFAEGKLHFQHADTDHQLVRHPSPHTTVSHLKEEFGVQRYIEKEEKNLEKTRLNLDKSVIK